MRITLIGMSNVGKTYWANKLAEVGFQVFSCDDLIEEKLASELQKYGYKGIHDVARWMGQPFDKQYSQTSARYLSFETEVMKSILFTLVNNGVGQKNIVIDTTASVIYTDDIIMDELKRLTKIVYLDTPLKVQKEMYFSYLKYPKPVIWGNSFKKRQDESDFEALSRCYPNLLAYRTKRYKLYADISLDYFLLRTQEFSSRDFLSAI